MVMKREAIHTTESTSTRDITCFPCRTTARTIVEKSPTNWRLYRIVCPVCGAQTPTCLKRARAIRLWQEMQFQWAVERRRQHGT